MGKLKGNVPQRPTAEEIAENDIFDIELLPFRDPKYFRAGNVRRYIEE